MTSKDIKAKAGQVWKFPDTDRNLYVISKIDIGGLQYFSPVNINEGTIGPLCYTEEDAADFMVFVAHSVADLSKEEEGEKE